MELKDSGWPGWVLAPTAGIILDGIESIYPIVLGVFKSFSMIILDGIERPRTER